MRNYRGSREYVGLSAWGNLVPLCTFAFLALLAFSAGFRSNGVLSWFPVVGIGFLGTCCFIFSCYIYFGRSWCLASPMIGILAQATKPLYFYNYGVLNLLPRPFWRSVGLVRVLKVFGRLFSACGLVRGVRGRKADQDGASGLNQLYSLRVGMVSPYPRRGEKHVATGGVASYARNLAEALAERAVAVTVIADTLRGEREGSRETGGIKVIRCWPRNPGYVACILLAVWRYRREFDVVHLQHENFMYGGLFSAGVFPLLVYGLRILRKKVVVTLHQVPASQDITASFVRSNRLKGPAGVLRLMLKTITWLICRGSHAVVVHQRYFKELLIDEYSCSPNNIWVIPHGIEGRSDHIPPEVAKRHLNVEDKRVLLFFGYLSGYKGLEALIGSFAYLKPQEKYLLIIAGGEHPRYKNDPAYKQSLAALKKRARSISPNIRFTGFVPEEDIPVYFGAAELVILPYTQAFSSSGPMSLAIAYEKPVLISNIVARTLDKVVPHAEPTEQALAQAIMKFFSDESLRIRTRIAMRDLKRERSWKQVAQRTIELYKSL